MGRSASRVCLCLSLAERQASQQTHTGVLGFRKQTWRRRASDFRTWSQPSKSLWHNLPPELCPEQPLGVLAALGSGAHSMPHTGTETTCMPPRARGRRSYLPCFRHKKTTSPIPPSQWTEHQGLLPTEPPLFLRCLVALVADQLVRCVCVCVCVFGKQGRGEENTSTHPSPSPFWPRAQINLLLILERQSWLSRRASPHPQACSSP